METMRFGCGQPECGMNWLTDIDRGSSGSGRIINRKPKSEMGFRILWARQKKFSKIKKFFSRNSAPTLTSKTYCRLIGNSRAYCRHSPRHKQPHLMTTPLNRPAEHSQRGRHLARNRCYQKMSALHYTKAMKHYFPNLSHLLISGSTHFNHLNR